MFYFILVLIFLVFIAIGFYALNRLNKKLANKYNILTFIDDWSRGALSGRDKFEFILYNVILLINMILIII